MPALIRGETSIYYEESGTGFPVLLFAPGGMRSAIDIWDKAPYHPVRELAGEHRVVAMDQRNAGRSRAPVHATDGWDTYADDHVALLDHLGIARCHVLGGCIGGAFALRLVTSAPERVGAIVLQQPIGFSGSNRDAFHRMFDDWASDLVKSRPEVTAEALGGMRARFYNGDFAFSVSRDEVRRCAAPLLVLRGNDLYHPAEVSEEIARIAPRAELVASWKEGTTGAAPSSA